jgi:hypothetical protein
MSHIKEYKSTAKSPEDRNLGDEWLDWDGKDGGIIKVGKGLFLSFSAAVILISDILLVLLVYFISPRLAMFIEELPIAAWVLAGLYVVMTAFWFLELLLTSYHEKNFFLFQPKPHLHFEMLFTRALKLSKLFGFSRDQLGHSFVKVYNSVSRAVRKPGPNEKLLILLPRCLTKDELKKIMDFKHVYGVEVCTVSGGELARKKVKEFKPTAVIGVACERDLVSGIRDVGGKFSVIGIPNIRPHGPCKDTHVDMDELEKAIRFYVGPPRQIVKDEISHSNG